MTDRRGWLVVLMTGLLSPAWTAADEPSSPPPPREQVLPDAPRSVAPLPAPEKPARQKHYRYGSFVSGRVSLYTRVRVEDCHNIAPGAVPVIVAIKDPNLCRTACRCCGARCVFVQVYVPPCRLWRLKVNRYGTDVKLDYGEYEVEIESRRGVVKVDYDD